MQHVGGFSSEIAVHVNMKYDFVKIVCAYEHSVTLSVPPKAGALDVNLQDYFYPALIVQQVVGGFKLNAEESRMRGLSVLQDLLLKYECDLRLSDPIL